jgi:hypothetical protein
VDFADLWIVLRGELTKVFLFTLRLSFSGRAVHRASATRGQEAFLDGHVYAFDRLGGYAGVGPSVEPASRPTWGSPPRSAGALDALPGPVGWVC